MKFLPVLLLLGPFLAQAQFKNITLDEGYKNTERSGTAVAINRKNPENMVAATMHTVYHTNDLGNSWQKAEDHAAAGYTCPQVVCDRKGNFYYFYLSGTEAGRRDRIVCRVSEDGGATWKERGEVTAGDAGIPHVFIHPKSGELLLAWPRLDKAGSSDPGHKSHIMFSRSKDGKKWSDPVRINQLEGDCLNNDGTVQGAWPAATMDELLFVAWGVNQKIFLDRSFNKGNTWLTNDISIHDQYGGWALDIPGIPYANGLPVLLVDNSPSRYNGSLNLVWADQRKGSDHTTIWYSRSVNYGDNWTSAARINNDPESTHQFMPAMTIDQATGHIYILYYDSRGEDGATSVYLAYSADSGSTFSNVKISENSFLPAAESHPGAYTGIDAYRGNIIPVWTRTDNGKTITCTAVIKHDDLVKLTASQ